MWLKDIIWELFSRDNVDIFLAMSPTSAKII
jgi:hypothetical protein